MRREILVLLCLMTSIFSCKKRMYYRSTAAYIIGNNDIKPVDSSNKRLIADKYLKASVAISTRLDFKSIHNKSCSGTLIKAAVSGGNYRILTNHHCFAEVDSTNNNKISEKLIPGACKLTKVIFGAVKGETGKSEVIGCREGSLHNIFDSDLAVFELEKNPSAKYAPVPISTKTGVPIGYKVSVVHFPNTDADRKNAEKLPRATDTGLSEVPIAQLTIENCIVLGRFPPAEWHLDSALKWGVKHSCDQKKGSSGSSLWDVEDQAILGVNWGGD